MSYETLRLTDKNTIRAFLNQDRDLTAYALGDLDDAFWPQSEFYGARRDGALVSLLLMYRGLDPVVLTAFGEADGVRAIFDTGSLPEEVYYLFPLDLGDLLSAYYERPNTKREWRMVLDHGTFTAPALDSVRRITPDQAPLLTDLYRHAADPGEEIVAFSPWQIAHGVFFGVWQGEELVAAAGTHVWSVAEKVVAIGNVFTQPAHRGHGYATWCTAAVTAESLSVGMDRIILNVREDNDPAIHVYEKLGFRRCCLFWEGPALRRARR